MLDGDYYGTVGSSEIGKFFRMKPDECDIGISYEPGTLGRLNILTMRMENSCGSKQDFGQDKIWISTFNDSGVSYEFCAGSDNTTRVSILTEDTEYENCDQKICTHGLEVGDLIHIYDTYTCQNQSIRFNGSNIDVTIDGTGLQVTGTFGSPSKSVDFSKFVSPGDYLLINGEVRKIHSISNDGTIVVVTYAFTTPGATILSAYSYNLPSGVQGSGCSCLTTKCGVRVVSVVSTTEFDINVPYSQLTSRYAVGGDTDAITRQVFFIKDKLQINYALKIRIKENDNSNLRSYVVNQGIY